MTPKKKASAIDARSSPVLRFRLIAGFVARQSYLTTGGVSKLWYGAGDGR